MTTTYQIYNIRGWVDDGGEALHEEEDGCATLTGWEWTEATDDEGAMASFNTDFFMKAGCVERAIVSAGGPKIQCDGQPIDWFDSKQAAHPEPSLTPEQEQEATDAYGADGHIPQGAPRPTYTPMNWAAWGTSHNVSTSAVPRTRSP